MRTDFSLAELAGLLIRRIGTILLCCVIGAVGGFGISKLWIPPVYQADALLYVQAGEMPSQSALKTAQELVDSYKVVLTGRDFLARVCQEAQTGDTAAALQAKLKMTGGKSAPSLQISVADNNPQRALALCKAILALAPAEISQVVGESSLKMIEQPTLPLSPISPSLPVNTIIGGMIGGIVSFLVLLIAAMLDGTIIDDRIKSGEDLKRSYQGELLGEIPDLQSQNQ